MEPVATLSTYGAFGDYAAELSQQGCLVSYEQLIQPVPLHSSMYINDLQFLASDASQRTYIHCGQNSRSFSPNLQASIGASDVAAT